MAKIYAPNKDYTGVSASVPFANGVGETSNPVLLAWFREHGYTIGAKATEGKAKGDQDPPKDPPEDHPEA